MRCYVGIDLHATTCYIAIINQDGRVIFKQKVPNNITTILQIFQAFKKDIEAMAVESTFNWYWLVDGLRQAGYPVRLANPAAMQQYKGLKYTDDRSDALWIAEMLRLKILPQGYIYPKEQRAVRDLLRKRTLLVKYRTALILSLKGMIHNWTGQRLTRSQIKRLEHSETEKLFSNTHALLSIESLQEVISGLNERILNIEKSVLKQIHLRQAYKKLLGVWGIAEILAITIMLETGDIRRFAGVGNYSSYCRCVPTAKHSNEKKKGSGNKKNGNRYLAWAYIEAAHYMQRYYLKARQWYQKKAARSGKVVATKALSNKIARACYYVMRDNIEFNPARLFN